MDPNIHQALMVLGAYGIVQVLSQDLGVKTGKKQRDLIQSPLVLAVTLYAGAYTVTGEINSALMAVVMYYFLKYIYSQGETSNVCSEDV